MATVTYTQTDLDNLKAALVSGAEEIVIDGKKVKFRSQKDILAVIALAMESIEGVSSEESASTIQATFSKGQS